VTRDSPGAISACAWRALDCFPDLTRLHECNRARYPHLLESVAHGPAAARHDILFAFPGPNLILRADESLWRDQHQLGSADFLAAFDNEWRANQVAARELPDLPFSGGWFVFLAYEFAGQIEPVLGPMRCEPCLPLALATRFPAAIIRDHARRIAYLVCEEDRASEILPLLAKDVAAMGGLARSRGERITVPIREDGADSFLTGVDRVLRYIGAGDVFQVNLSRGWTAEAGGGLDATELYRRLRRANPAPFAALASLAPGLDILSSSPERLVEVRGGHIATRPIAGTYPRSGDPSQDDRWRRELRAHPKERAEHVMLLDLERNDLGRLCRPGTVRVSEFMTVESYRHVHHLVSEVRGGLGEGITPGDVVRAVFPGGTITGAPKIRCMQIISELESAPRGVYTGSLGYVNRDGSMDLNILIRTMAHNAGQIQFRAGAGIVADSDPARELEETRNKARGMIVALDGI